MEIERNKDITSLTTFGIKAEARLFAEYSSLKELERIMRSDEYRDNEVMHIGGGSNLLFMREFNGLILHSAIKGITAYDKDADTHYVIAGAGEKWTDFVDWCVDNGYAGLENLAGIPGEVGAAPVQNVGAYGAEAGDFIFAVECYDVLQQRTVRLTHEECRFGYRDSMFKREGNGRYYVLRVSFRLRKSETASNLEYGPLKDLEARLGHTPTVKEVRDEVLKIRDSKLPDPKVIGSAGSFFKNPVVNKYYFTEEVLRRCPEVPSFELNDHEVKVSASWLIDHAGLKGMRCGNAAVWEKQPLVIVNEGGASAEDTKHLSDTIKRKVSEKYGILLKPEVNFVDTSVEVTVLGTGTSKGVPEVGCKCSVCLSDDPRDKRLRTSVWVKTHGLSILLDVSPDFRQQALTHDINMVDAAFITHSHYDHVGGIDDLRPFCTDANLPLYMQEDVENDLRNRIDYCFRKHPYPGVPVFDIHRITADRPFHFRGVEIVPIAVNHGKLPILGYRIGNFAFITDAKTIDEWELDKLEGVDTLLVNALRIRPHFAHFSLEETLALIEKIKPRRAYLTHMNHEMGRHAEIDSMLPPNVHFAYDGLTFRCD